MTGRDYLWRAAGGPIAIGIMLMIFGLGFSFRGSAAFGMISVGFMVGICISALGSVIYGGDRNVGFPRRLVGGSMVLAGIAFIVVPWFYAAMGTELFIGMWDAYHGV